MTDRSEASTRLFGLLYPPRSGRELPSADVDLNRFAFLVLMCTHANLFAATFPLDGPPNPQAVYDTRWFTAEELPPQVITRLAGSRSTLASIQLAWFFLADQYEDPPCPEDEQFGKLVDFIKGL